MTYKKCSLCQQTKSVEEFHRCFKKHDGLQNNCKICHKQYRLREDIHSRALKRGKIYKKSRLSIEKYREKERIRMRVYLRKRKQTDICFKLRAAIRTRISLIVSNRCKGGSGIRDLGCSLFELKTYLESKFQPGMSWDNYGLKGWHIDHIVPLSRFDLTNPTQFKKAVHYTNLQPLWAKDNQIKSNKVSGNLYDTGVR